MTTAIETGGAPVSAEPEDPTGFAAAEGHRAVRRQLLRSTVVVLIVGLAVTGALAWLSQVQYSNTERRLLALRVRDTSLVLTEATSGIQTALGSAAELADVTHGNVSKFRQFIEPYIRDRQFESVSLWRLNAPQRGPVAVAGVAPKLAAGAPVASFFRRAALTSRLAVIGLLARPDPRVGYEYNTPSVPGGFAAYGEAPLPADHRSPIARTSPFAGLDYALYLGHHQRSQELLLASRTPLPLTGDTVAQTVAFGDNALTLVMSSRVSLAGALPRALPWIVLVLGVLLSGATAIATLRLTQRRLAAERLAARLDATAQENERLYAEQRTIAQTLQHALLPDRLPTPPGTVVSAIYEPGERGVEVGGDWYDVLELGAGRLLLVVGDVSGRGLRAATTMAELRFAIRAYARQGDEPAEILTKVSRLLDVVESKQLATILCVLLDADRNLTLASAGHLPPLLVAGGESAFLDAPVGVPIGVPLEEPYRSRVVPAPHAATLIAYTDGLVERRGEAIDAGLERLRTASIGRDPDVDLPDLLRALVAEVSARPSTDDVAIVGIRWSAEVTLPGGRPHHTPL